MSADEFEVIRALFAPLATDAGARGLSDDVALLTANGTLVVTTDAIVEGVHFLPDDPIETVAKKVLRVNLSDLTAKGARCVGVLLTLIWPRSRAAAEIAAFVAGLSEDLRAFDVPLLGGDTTSTPGPLTISITAFGAQLGARTPARSDARVGDQVWVTGEIGDAWLGLMNLSDEPSIIGATTADQTDAFARHVRARYRVPEPPVAFAQVVAQFANASTDVSDGLIADARNIALASNAAVRIDAESVPLSGPGHAYVAAHGVEGLMRLVSGGDDYQVLFTALPERRGDIQRAAREAGVRVALIGDVEPGAGVRLAGAGGKQIPISIGGHSHSLGQ